MRALVLLVILLAFPVLEFYVLWRLSGILGGWLLVWLVASAVAGWALLRQVPETFATGLLHSALQGGSPLRALLSGGATLLAGLLLIFPGVISDVLALILLALTFPRRPPPRTPPADNVIEGEFHREE